MYVNILKKDLKRKKTMNIILLLFVILASMFVSSGMSNVITVMNGTDYFLDQAGIGDYIVITQNDGSNVAEMLQKEEHVTGYRTEHCFWAGKEDISVNGKAVDMKNNTLVLQSLQKQGIRYYHTDDTELKTVKDGEIYVTAGFLQDNQLSVGDSMRIQLHGTDRSYRIAGEIKDALLGSDMMGNIRLIISDADFDYYQEQEALKDYAGCIFCIDSDRNGELSSKLTEMKGILFSGSRDMIKLCYVMEMIVAMIVLVLSICLVIVSFVLLKFVITFSMQEEYREIGVMKAIGIRNLKIRSLYMTKYVGISVFGGIVGFAAGIPFGKLLLKSVTTKMILGNQYGLVLNVIGAVLVILVMLLFTYICTGMVKKSTPVDAIRNGQKGERYKKKAVLSIQKSHFSNAFFMAVNDLLCAPKRFLTIIISFFLCSILMFGIVLVADTMKSDRLITTFGKKSDVYITDSKLMKMEYMSAQGNEDLPNSFRQMEEDLKKMGMPGTVSMEVWYKYPLTFDGKDWSITCQQNKETKADEYEYTEGFAPQNANEIAITLAIADEIGAGIGDRVVIDFGSEQKECVITGYFQTMNQLGSVIRLHETAPTAMEHASAIMSYQIDFADAPDEQEIRERIKKIKAYYGIEDVYDAAEYCMDCMKVADTLDAAAKLLLVITIIVVVLVTVLMERSFISTEKTQIALLKAIGFTERFIMKWQIYRFLIVTVIAEVLAIALTMPVTKLWCDPIWKQMGAANVDYYFKPLSLIVVYPGMILLVNLIAVFLTALYTRKITSRDVMNIE